MPDHSVPGAAPALPPPRSLPPAQVDEYEIIRSLGGGAMGQVYLAQDAVLGRPVAVKFIAQDNPSDASRERFLIEARAIARLQHPNVLAIYRVGLVNGQPYLASEFVRGQSLDKLALPLPWQRALDIAVQLARGLGAAHRQGVAKIQYNRSRRLWPIVSVSEILVEEMAAAVHEERTEESGAHWNA